MNICEDPSLFAPFIARLIFVCLSFVTPSAFAIFQVSVPLLEEQTRDAPEAQSQAVTQVLERITGQVVDPNGRLAGVLQEPARWIQSSGFLTELDEVSRVVTYTVDPGIASRVRAMQLPVWLEPRPPQWLWLVIDEGLGREALTADSSGELARAFRAQAERWQLPLALPQWDAQDLSLVSYGELWGLFLEGVELAHARYGDEFVAGRALKRGQQWQLAVKTSSGERLSQSYPSADALAADLFRYWLEPLIDQYAVSGEGELELRIAGLDGQGYRQLIRYLRRSSVIDQALPTRSTTEGVVLRVLTGARPDQLATLLAGLPMSPLAGDETGLDWVWMP